MDWFEVVQFLQSICHGEAHEGTKTKTDWDTAKFKRKGKVKKLISATVTKKNLLIKIMTYLSQKQ